MERDGRTDDGKLGGTQKKRCKALICVTNYRLMNRKEEIERNRSRRLDSFHPLLDLVRVPQLNLRNPHLVPLELIPVSLQRLALLNVRHQSHDERLHPRRDEIAEKA